MSFSHSAGPSRDRHLPHAPSLAFVRLVPLVRGHDTASVRRRSGVPKAELVIVANRLPVDRVAHPDGSTTWRRSPGGLVTALEPVMRQNHGAWIGWDGRPDEAVTPFEDHGLSLVPVPITT